MHAPYYTLFVDLLILVIRSRKFFGRPTGSLPKPQQSKLAFQKPHTSKAVKDKDEKVDGVVKAEHRKEADVEENDIVNEDVDTDSTSEVNESAVDTKQVNPVINGIDKASSAFANGKGELSTQNFRLASND